jgi:hypothetical protein
MNNIDRIRCGVQLCDCETLGIGNPYTNNTGIEGCDICLTQNIKNSVSLLSEDQIKKLQDSCVQNLPIREQSETTNSLGITSDQNAELVEQMNKTEETFENYVEGFENKDSTTCKIIDDLNEKYEPPFEEIFDSALLNLPNDQIDKKWDYIWGKWGIWQDRFIGDSNVTNFDSKFPKKEIIKTMLDARKNFVCLYHDLGYTEMDLAVILYPFKTPINRKYACLSGDDDEIGFFGRLMEYFYEDDIKKMQVLKILIFILKISKKHFNDIEIIPHDTNPKIKLTTPFSFPIHSQPPRLTKITNMEDVNTIPEVDLSNAASEETYKNYFEDHLDDDIVKGDLFTGKGNCYLTIFKYIGNNNFKLDLFGSAEKNRFSWSGCNVDIDKKYTIDELFDSSVILIDRITEYKVKPDPNDFVDYDLIVTEYDKNSNAINWRIEDENENKIDAGEYNWDVFIDKLIKNINTVKKSHLLYCSGVPTDTEDYSGFSSTCSNVWANKENKYSSYSTETIRCGVQLCDCELLDIPNPYTNNNNIELCDRCLTQKLYVPYHSFHQGQIKKLQDSCVVDVNDVQY